MSDNDYVYHEERISLFILLRNHMHTFIDYYLL